MRDGLKKIRGRWWHLVPTNDVAVGDMIVFLKTKGATPHGWRHEKVKKVSKKGRSRKSRWVRTEQRKYHGHVILPSIRVFMHTISEVWRRGYKP